MFSDFFEDLTDVFFEKDDDTTVYILKNTVFGLLVLFLSHQFLFLLYCRLKIC